jgi:hypothetical protein
MDVFSSLEILQISTAHERKLILRLQKFCSLKPLQAINSNTNHTASE